MTVLLVDWLGRGGIAQCSQAWVHELVSAGREVVVVTRGDRELAGTDLGLPDQDRGGRIASHLRLVRRAAGAIRELRPSTVVVQNYVLAALEGAVYRAARDVGARLVVVVHDHRHHTRLSGVRFGLDRLLRQADDLVAHSSFVAEAIGRYAGRSVAVIPHPVQLGVLEAPRPVRPLIAPGHRQLAVHFGVLRRAENKGTDLVVALARRGQPGWTFAFGGSGAPRVPGAVTVDRFLEPGELVDLVEGSDATLLPYRFASQSGAVVLAQALGSVPVVTSVGGLPEQVVDGSTGLVVRGAGPDALGRALERLGPDEVASIGAQAKAAAWDEHRRFVQRILAFA